MQARRSTLTLVLALGALVLAAHAALDVRHDSRAPDHHLDALEARLTRMEATRNGDVRHKGHEAILRGRGPDRRAVSDAGTAVRIEPAAQDPGASTQSAAAPWKGLEAPERIEELVEATVEKKAAQLQVMSNKKPSIELFAETIQLTEGQRYDVEQAVVRGQHELRALLETPTADGTILLDDLVEVLAHDLVDPEQSRRNWSGFLGRILSERVPGTEETYALRAEAVKAAVREDLRRTLTDEQFNTFEAWRLDPTEIQEIEGSPWKALEPQVLDRAETLGAETPAAE